MLHRPAQGPTPSNQLLHDTVTMQDPLGVGRCGEAAHLTLRLARRLMGSFGALVRVLGRVVGATGHDVPLGTSGAAPRVGHETTRVLSLTLQACSEASPRRPPVPTGVDEKVTPVTVVVHGAQAFSSSSTALACRLPARVTGPLRTMETVARADGRHSLWVLTTPV